MPTYAALIQLINDMYKVDQGLRLGARPGHDRDNYLVYLADAAHNYRIHKIIKEYGYPKSDTIGSETLKKFWLLVQHQDYDLSLQLACLANCDFAPTEKAYLTDRTRMNQDMPQIYGTQSVMKNGIKKLYKIENAEDLEHKRKEVGLPPLDNEA